MKKISRIIVYLVVVSLLLTNMSAYAATDNRTRNDKATILNTLGILHGDGISYNLDGQLKRSEAATFIIRLIGKENEVLNNKAKYSDVDFSDVSATDWYAPYVGYCKEKGIIAGFLDNTFRAEEYVSEKVFLKLLLTALGYEYNLDFTWDSVYSSAYNLGLVKDEKYKVVINDNVNYSRGQVVSVLYEALKTRHKVTQERMVQSFVASLLISKSDAVTYGLMEDDLETELTSINVIDENTIEVVFNESIKSFTPDNMVIYDKDNTTKLLEVDHIIQGEVASVYHIETKEAQQPDVNYSIIISDVIDNYGNKSTTFNDDFLGFRPDEVVSDFFMISKVEAISSNLIYLYYTQPINDNVVQATLYNIKKDDSVVVEGSNSDIQLAKLSTCDNGISIYTKNYAFSEEEIYTLAVSGDTTSQYGVRLRDGEGDTIKFQGSSRTNEVFEVKDISTPNKNTLELTFNQAVNDVLAKQVFSYYLTTKAGVPIQIKAASVSTDGMTVHLTVNTMFANKSDYNIMINNINDISRQFYITEKSYDFEAIYGTTSNVKIDAVFPLDATTVLFYVDRPLDEATANAISHYQIYGVTNRSYVGIPSAIYYNKAIDPQLVKVYLPENRKLNGTDSYELRLMTSLKDEMGNSQTAIQKMTFKHNKTSVSDVTFTEAKIVGENTIKLTFNKEIALDIPNVLNTNYELSYTENGFVYKKTPIGANYINPTTLILKFDLLDLEKTYQISYGRLIDYGGVETDNLNGEYSKEVVMGE